jgi:hypothetical protein
MKYEDITHPTIRRRLIGISAFHQERQKEKINQIRSILSSIFFRSDGRQIVMKIGKPIFNTIAPH